ncbi:hypothetical protein AYI69_g8631 [Smittium culicis]|uniref:Uncharacterized protein n=1 Tax=Smittium culicis TaxID=133412 RepID=A0A1R1XI94_9FUNG|nr:hypothetical protein AYI69_g8631 [Smittium culicis]
MLTLPNEKACSIISNNQAILSESVTKASDRIKQNASKLAYLQSDEKTSKTLLDFSLNSVNPSELIQFP